METITIKSSVAGIFDRLFGEQADSAPTQDEIRKKAYILWEEAGRPDGDGVEFWLRAEAELQNVGG